MGRAKNFIKKANKSIKDFREKAKKPREPITTKASMFSIISWAFYDLGNTIFSVLIVSFYFGLWVVSDDVGGTDSDLFGGYERNDWVDAAFAMANPNPLKALNPAWHEATTRPIKNMMSK